MKKLISWNVNGLRACVGKGFLDYFKEVDADVFCIQESKLQEGQIDLELPGYYQYWNYAEKKGYSGTAMLTMKDGSLPQSFRSIMWLPVIRLIQRTGWQDFLTV